MKMNSNSLNNNWVLNVSVLIIILNCFIWKLTFPVSSPKQIPGLKSQKEVLSNSTIVIISVNSVGDQVRMLEFSTVMKLHLLPHFTTFHLQNLRFQVMVNFMHKKHLKLLRNAISVMLNA
jgi:hypothetical protein